MIDFGKTDHDEWLENPENLRAYQEEALVHDASDLLYGLLEESGLSQSELAAQLGCSEANVSQMLGGGRNLTLRTLARAAFALGFRIRVQASAVEGTAGLETVPRRCARGKMTRRHLPR